MPVLDRLDWISRQFAMHRRGFISIGEAQDIGKLKIKITVEPPTSGSISAAVSLGLQCTLTSLRPLISQNVSTDRGHKHSDGRSIISIWVTQGGCNPSDLSPLPPAPPSFLPVDHDSSADTYGDGPDISQAPVLSSVDPLATHANQDGDTLPTSESLASFFG